MAERLFAERSLPLRFMQHPLTRLVLLGGLLFVLMGVATSLRAGSEQAPLRAFASVAAVTAFTILVYVGFVRLVERRQATELALTNMGRELGFGMLIGAGLYSTTVFVLMQLGVYRIEALNPAAFLLTALPMALSSSVFEELLFRGVLFRIVEETLGSWIALAVSSLVFGLLHLLNPQATLAGALFISTEAGLLLAAAYMMTRRLWMSIGFHFAWNYTQSGIFSGVVSGGVSSPGLVRSTVEGPDLLTGGEFGLEASLIAFLLCTATGLILLAMAVRRGKVRPPAWPARLTTGVDRRAVQTEAA